MSVDLSSSSIGPAFRPAAVVSGAARDGITWGELERETRADRALLEGLFAQGIWGEPTSAVELLPPGALDTTRAAMALERTGLPRSEVLVAVQLAASIGALEARAVASEAARTTPDLDRLRRTAALRADALRRLTTAVSRDVLSPAYERLRRLGDRARVFAREAVYVPSGLFVERWGLEWELDELRAELGADPSAMPTRVRLGRLLLGLGRYEEAAEHLERSGNGEVEAKAYLGLGRALAGETGAAVVAARAAYQLAPHSPRVVSFLGVALALHATGGAAGADAGPLLREALVLVAQSAALRPDDDREALEAGLARGRVRAVLPFETTERQEALDALERVLALTERRPPDPEIFDFPGAAALYRINALYFLGMDAVERGDRELGRRRLRECIAIDPASGFAQRAYERLGG